MGLTRIVTAFVMIALFSLAVVTYIVGFSNDNTTYTQIDSTDSKFKDFNTLIKQNITDSNADTQGSIEAMWKSEVSDGDTTTRTGGQFKTSPASVFSTTKVILSTVFSVIFENDAGFKILLTTFIGLLGFILGMYVWKAWKGGSPD